MIIQFVDHPLTDVQPVKSVMQTSVTLTLTWPGRVLGQAW